jgi:hypothetical protein
MSGIKLLKVDRLKKLQIDKLADELWVLKELIEEQLTP